jgi:hypothetical protein
MAQSSIDALQKLLISNDNKEKVRYNTPSYITKRRTNETVVEGVHYRFDSSDRALIFKKLINTYGKDFFIIIIWLKSQACLFYLIASSFANFLFKVKFLRY